MAAPNLYAPTTCTGKTVGAALGITLTTALLTNAAASGKVLKVNSMYVANVDGTNSADLTVSVNDASAATTYKLANTIAVAADSTLVVIEKDSPIYLEEGDILQGGASAAGDLECIISYEDIS
jgi:hypothetical protein